MRFRRWRSGSASRRHRIESIRIPRLAARRPLLPDRPGGSNHHLPEDNPRLRLVSPEDEAHAVAIVAGQPASDSTAFGVANGVKEPVTVPFLIVILVIPIAPLTEKFEGCFQMVFALPGGVVHCILSCDPAAGAGSDAPLKMVAQLLAEPAILNRSAPVITPDAAMPAVPMQGLAELPRVA